MKIKFMKATILGLLLAVSAYSQDKPKQWIYYAHEYVKATPPKVLATIFNKLGAEGWELTTITCETPQEASLGPLCTAFFKRPLQEAK